MEYLDKMHSKLLEMALYFAEFTKKHNLKVFLCGGGCIGAVRHKGFIPWDDDLDFLMPRKDYDKLMQIWKENYKDKDYSLIKQDVDFQTRLVFTALVDNNTTYIKDFQKDLDIPQGVTIDIFPFDGYPKNKISQLLQKYNALKFTIYSSGQVARNSGFLAKMISSTLLFFTPGYKRRYKKSVRYEKRMKKYDLDKCDEMIQLCEGPYNIFHAHFNKHIFDEQLWVDFEGKKLPIPKGYDEFLTKTFGKYMELPPVDKRKPHHDAIFLDLEKPYLEYKGIEYLTNK